MRQTRASRVGCPEMSQNIVAISGSSGLLGKSLTSALTEDSWVVRPMVRERPRSEVSGAVYWNPVRQEIDPEGLNGVSAVIHLAGANVAAGRWTDERKAEIRDSRVLGTRLLAGTIAQLEQPPSVFVAASAIGIYGDRGAEPVTEESAPGSGFLADVCRAWESEMEPIARAGVRLVVLRIGIVLAKDGGALAKMITPFSMGAGGRVGSGEQYMSWVSLADVVRMIRFAIDQPGVEGIYNAVAPEPVTNESFTRTLGTVLNRPAVVPLPAFAARLMLGREMANALLLGGARVIPKRFEEGGFQWQHPALEPALRAAIDEPARA